MTSLAKKIIIGVAIAAVVGIMLIGILAGAAVLGWRAAMRAGNEAATIQNLKTIAAVETQYFDTHNRTFATFDQLVREQMLSSKFAGSPPAPEGYALTLTIRDRWASYTLSADPIDDSYGKHHFYLDSGSSQIHVNADEPAGPQDPVFDKN